MAGVIIGVALLLAAIPAIVTSHTGVLGVETAPIGFLFGLAIVMAALGGVVALFYTVVRIS